MVVEILAENLNSFTAFDNVHSMLA